MRYRDVIRARGLRQPPEAEPELTALADVADFEAGDTAVAADFGPGDDFIEGGDFEPGSDVGPGSGRRSDVADALHDLPGRCR